MRFGAAVLVLSFAPALIAIDPKNSPADYPVQGAVADFKAGVEYMVRSFSGEGQSFIIEDYLIVEVGVYPQREANLDLRRFTLRLNGKMVAMTQTPGMVAASLKYPDWTAKPSVEAGVGLPGRDIVFGRRQPVQRFPGDPRAYPEPQRNPNGQVIDSGQPAPIDYENLVKRAALPEGKFNRPLAGLIFFPYDGKLKKIRTVELLIDEIVLKLR